MAGWILSNRRLVAVFVLALLASSIGLFSASDASAVGVRKTSEPTTVSVTGAVQWTNTGLNLTPGTNIQMTASGVVTGMVGEGDPAGTPWGACSNQVGSSRHGNVVVPGLPCWSLIGRFGNNTPFEVGDGVGTVAESGTLFLGVNDNLYSDNVGSWSVNVSNEHGSAQYVALGDSYASGLGSFSYLPGTNKSQNGCDQATDGYVKQLATDLGYALGFEACSGATIDSLVEGSNAQESALGHDTRVVTLSIGGNDVGFAPVLTSCVSGPGSPGRTGCAGRDAAALSKAFGWLEHGRAPGQYILPGVDARGGRDEDANGEPLPNLVQLYKDIASAAPNAQIIVVGYPELFESSAYSTGTETTACKVGTNLGILDYTISASDVQWLDREANALDQVIGTSVSTAAGEGVDVSFLDLRPLFVGRGLCDSGRSDLNGLVFDGAKFWHRDLESFHPNQSGQNILASALEKQLGL
ncbi:MAG: SGNH/GDSL hydrolase family protein [Acidimicrobiales bacterium]